MSKREDANAILNMKETENGGRLMGERGTWIIERTSKNVTMHEGPIVLGENFPVEGGRQEKGTMSLHDQAERSKERKMEGRRRTDRNRGEGGTKKQATPWER